MSALLPAAPAVEAYDGLAAHYDAFTEGHEYDRWLDALEALALEAGLRGRRLLDVGCGTGKSFLPMLRRGYEVVACDVSPEMLACARGKVGGAAVRLVAADMRTLPRLGAFDLVTCIDDAVNYLTSADQLRAALEGFARNLRPGGVAVFDANTLATFRAAYSQDAVLESRGTTFRIRGEGDPRLAPGGTASVWIDVLDRPGGRPPTATHHLHRHHPRAEVERALKEAGLELVATRGQSPGVRICPEPDEELHAKTLYVARRPA